MTTILNPTELAKIQRELADKITAHAPLDEIRILLASGAQVNGQVVQGLRPLHYAVYGNNPDCVRLLMVRGCDVNALDEVGYSPTHLCAERGYYELLVYLISQNAKTSYVDVSERNRSERPETLHTDEPLRLAIKNGHYDCALLLLENGANPNASYFFGSEIHLLAPDDVKFLKLLLMYGADPNTYDRDGLTPLMKTARHRDGLERVTALVENGALINAVATERQDFRTPLHYAVLSGCSKIVSYLIEKGAHVNMSSDYNKPSPLDFAVLRDQSEIVELLLNEGADPNKAQTFIGTPLHLACCSELVNQRPIVEILLKFGADPNSTPMFDNVHLKSPFVEYFRTRTTFDLALVKLFLAYGAKVIMQSPAKDPRGILRALSKLGADDYPLFDLLSEAGHCFDLKAVERCNMTFDRRVNLIRLASEPLSLKKFSRLCILDRLAPISPAKPLALPLPRQLQLYLLYDD